MFFRKLFRKRKTKEMLRDDFYDNLLKLNYVRDEDEIEKLIKMNKRIASIIPELNGWPYDPVKFWDIESAGWDRKINEKIRTEIKKELKGLKGLNLDIGCGSYAYVRNSVFLDLSFLMLKEMKSKNKIQFKVRDSLPFRANSFDSVTLLFVLNYLDDLSLIFREVKRILKSKGKLVIVQPKFPTDDFYKFQEKKHRTLDDIKGYLLDFKVNSYEKKIGGKELIFINAQL